MAQVVWLGGPRMQILETLNGEYAIHGLMIIVCDMSCMGNATSQGNTNR